jgi:hypothetical protein
MQKECNNAQPQKCMEAASTLAAKQVGSLKTAKIKQSFF